MQLAIDQASAVLLRALAARHADLGHSLEQVAELAKAVACRLGLPADDVCEIRRAAELHDVGKVGIPEQILQKPGRLDACELACMREHTLIGQRILEAATSLVPIGRLVRSSHEHWDGTGYPDGLAGGQIPLGSRIILACDAYDAMTSDRPYRRAISYDAALAELCSGSGSQFDPAVVSALRIVLCSRRVLVA